ncbi:tRNA (adenine(22)-N(1))-methyltransferase [Desulfoscipio gibsoniae]|nr:class I SAM-dependent methyltransferase [Desulfoscipio gibsoniae]
MELSKRLATVARHVPVGATVADIGTDHAYLPVYLVRRGISPRVVGVDINQGPFDAAHLTVRASGLDEYIDLRMGDGFNIIKPGEVSVVVVAGMGGKTICKILAQGREVLQHLRRLVLQPMRDIVMVRKWLTDNGWRLMDEEMVTEDGHYYVIIVAEPGFEKIKNSFALKLGPRLLEKKDAVLREFLKRRIIEINIILGEITSAHSSEANTRAQVLKQEAEEIEEVLSKW